MKLKKIRDEFGYTGKPKEWQIGFDALLKHLPDYLPRAVDVGEIEKISLAMCENCRSFSNRRLCGVESGQICREIAQAIAEKLKTADSGGKERG